MSDGRSRTTAVDWVVLALSPALVMALVTSLVYFLLEILYSGPFQGRMRWILFFFVFGVVLIARVSMMTEIRARAPFYGLVLGVLVWLGLQAFVEYPPEHPLTPFSWLVNLGLVALVWWCAHRLTWDCTFVDDKADAGGEGLLREAGLVPQPEVSAPADDGRQARNLTWWERYQRYREKSRKRTNGLWVVYFSLLALPLFGLGQSLIPTEDEDRRRYVFWLMSLYVGSGLGLLLTTCFLGIRRYLRQRSLQMPAAMTGVWLTVGGVLIALLLTAGALLPRPQAEYPVVDLGPFGSRDRQASRWAIKDDGAGKDEGRAAPGKADEKADAGRGEQQGQKEAGAKEGKSGQGDTGQKKGDGQGQKDAGGKGEQKGGDSGQKGGQESGDQKANPQRPKGDAQADTKQGSGGRRDEPRDGKKDAAGANAKQGQAVPKTLPHSNRNRVLDFLSKLSGLAPILKWVVFGLLVLVVLFLVLRSGLRWLANFTGWARQLLDALRAFWERLFGRRQPEAGAGDDVARPAKRPAPPAFALYRNPFLDGRAARLSPDEVVRYSFAALEAWAYERGLGRHADETPMEFAQRLGEDLPGLEADARRLAGLYARSLYARGALPAGAAEPVRQFWDRLEAVTAQPLSA